jgi:hypothetical protein
MHGYAALLLVFLVLMLVLLLLLLLLLMSPTCAPWQSCCSYDNKSPSGLFQTARRPLLLMLPVQEMHDARTHPSAQSNANFVRN